MNKKQELKILNKNISFLNKKISHCDDENIITKYRLMIKRFTEKKEFIKKFD